MSTTAETVHSLNETIRIIKDAIVSLQNKQDTDSKTVFDAIIRDGESSFPCVSVQDDKYILSAVYTLEIPIPSNTETESELKSTIRDWIAMPAAIAQLYKTHDGLLDQIQAITENTPIVETTDVSNKEYEQGVMIAVMSELAAESPVWSIVSLNKNHGHENNSGWSVAHEAATYNKLPNYFSNWIIADTSGWTVAHEAAKHGHLPTDFDQWDLCDKLKWSVAHEAAKRGDLPRHFRTWGVTQKQRVLREKILKEFNVFKHDRDLNSNMR